MRIVAGAHKGRKLKAAAGKVTRPTSDKIKESLFNQIGPFFQGGMCLDLYAGSGALGIEAISRGMKACVFIDKSPLAIQILKRNLEHLQLENHAHIYRSEAKSMLPVLHKKAHQFQLIFLDPPYDKADYTVIIQAVLKYELLAEGGVICCEHGVSQQLPASFGSLTIIKQKTYGSTTGITIYKNDKKKMEELKGEKISNLPRKF